MGLCPKHQNNCHLGPTRRPPADRVGQILLYSFRGWSPTGVCTLKMGAVVGFQLAVKICFGYICFSSIWLDEIQFFQLSLQNHLLYIRISCFHSVEGEILTLGQFHLLFCHFGLRRFDILIHLPVVHKDVWFPQRWWWDSYIFNVPVFTSIPCQVNVLPFLERKKG